MDFNVVEADRIDSLRLERELKSPLFVSNTPGGGKGAIWIDNDAGHHAFLYINLDDDPHAEFMIEISVVFQSIIAADLIL